MRAVPGLEHRVVERMHERRPGLLDEREQTVMRLGGAFGLEVDVGAVGLGSAAILIGFAVRHMNTRHAIPSSRARVRRALHRRSPPTR